MRDCCQDFSEFQKGKLLELENSLQACRPVWLYELHEFSLQEKHMTNRFPKSSHNCVLFLQATFQIKSNTGCELLVAIEKCKLQQVLVKHCMGRRWNLRDRVLRTLIESSIVRNDGEK